MIEAIIKEGGTTRVFANRAKLEVSLQGGGTTFFVPESETRLTTKRIEKNGVYKASDDGDYGWSTVTVAVSTTDSVTGTGADGKEHNYSVDGSGALVDQVVPSEIRITTPPNYVGPYGDGAILSFDGIVVHAYDALGNDMGEVPFNELVFPVTVARYDPEAGPLVYDMSSDLLASSVPCSAILTVISPSATEDVYTVLVGAGESGAATGWGGRNHSVENVTMFFAASSSTAKYTDGSYESFIDQYSAEFNGKTVYYRPHGFLHQQDVEPYLGYQAADADQPKIAWTMIYGDITGTSGGVQIPVEWSRTGDGLVLDTSFGVSVVPGPSGSGEEGGNASAVIPIEI